MVSPVMLPPGRARLVTSPAIRDGDTDEYDRDRAGRFLGGSSAGVAMADDEVNREANQLRGEPGKALEPPIGAASLDGDVLAFDVTELAQSRPQGLKLACRSAAEVDREPADSVIPPGLLRVGCERAARRPRLPAMNARRSIY